MAQKTDKFAFDLFGIVLVEDVCGACPRLSVTEEAPLFAPVCLAVEDPHLSLIEI